jgi:hypothetical protein
MKSFSHVVPLKTTNAKILKQQIVISFANACVCLLALISVCYPDCSGPPEDAVDISSLTRVNQAPSTCSPPVPWRALAEFGCISVYFLL